MANSLKVLIVDDSPGVRAKLKSLYQELGHEVVGECKNGLEAIEQAQQAAPDLVSLDIIMPDMDGIEAYRILRNMDQPPRCLLVTALGAESRVIGAYEREIKASHYCPKPVTKEQLAVKIEDVMADEPMPWPELPPEHQDQDGTDPGLIGS
jgi:two-component system chemotaxis response regulator CheY